MTSRVAPSPRVVAVAVGLVAVAVLAVVLVILRTSGLPEGVAFRVAGDDVSTETVDDRVGVLEALYGIEEPAGSKARDAYRRETAKAVAVSMVIDRRAASRSITVSDRDVDAEEKKFIDQQYAQDGREGFVRALGERGASEKQVREELRQQMVVSRLFDELTKDVTVTDADVAAAFTERRADLAVPERRRVRNIVVQTAKEAQHVLAVVGREKFADAAASLSLDGATKDKGGDLGLVAEAELDEEFGRAAFAARRGQPFGPVKTTHGWNVGVVDVIEPPENPTLAEVKTELRAALRAERAVAIWRSWLEKQVAGADVEYADSYRPDDPEALPDAPQLSTSGSAADSLRPEGDDRE
ncbi:hypothetical protein ASD11_14330 [Aeromicrobium sp. Root495]|uniref:peptidyl-prolyl cis-trans isomerase n=1 Tax=Aeromicrobium sp. Root495 TaxID=1736550 RepID=UPI0006F631EB|nr:peptidyl-prolyl cis-trans isomerase [Aeromicrobium sp. Root495]KQY55688.1 hypothetical protein ASD11_14330 [Aeromicrobium sp. Root495]